MIFLYFQHVQNYSLNYWLSVGSVYIFSGADRKILARFDGRFKDAEWGVLVSTAGEVNKDETPEVILGFPSFPPADTGQQGSLCFR